MHVIYYIRFVVCKCLRFGQVQNFVVFDCLTLPNNRMLDLSKLKAFADGKLNTAKLMISVCDGLETIVGKGENACYQHFVLYNASKAFLFRVKKMFGLIPDG